MAHAFSSRYEFKKKTVLLVDLNTGLPIKDETVVVYHGYEYACLTDGVRPSKCVNGSETVLKPLNGKIEIGSQALEKAHLTGRNPKVTFQVSGLCEGQEWHPGDCRIELALRDFNGGPDPLVVKIPFKVKAAGSVNAISPGATR